MNNRLKNPNWLGADQLAIYKHDRGVELGSTEKQLSPAKGLITLRISARAEISIRLAVLKSCCDCMTNFSPG